MTNRICLIADDVDDAELFLIVNDQLPMPVAILYATQGFDDRAVRGLLIDDTYMTHDAVETASRSRLLDDVLRSVLPAMLTTGDGQKVPDYPGVIANGCGHVVGIGSGIPQAVFLTGFAGPGHSLKVRLSAPEVAGFAVGRKCPHCDAASRGTVNH